MKTELIKVVGAGSVAGMAFAGAVAVELDVTQSVEASEVATEDSSGEAFACVDALSQNENSAVAAEYNKVAEADCMFVGCGGVF